VIDSYAEIRLVHIAFAVASGLLFALRGLAVLGRRGALANHGVVRYLSYSIDTVLLTAALMLLAMLRLSAASTSWLSLKLALLVVYILLGSFALRRAPTQRAKLICFVVALVTYGLIIGIARAHDPYGWFLLLRRT